MSVARCRELLAAWEAGAAREEDLVELRALLPAVLEAAERGEVARGGASGRGRYCASCETQGFAECQHHGDYE